MTIRRPILPALIVTGVMFTLALAGCGSSPGEAPPEGAAQPTRASKMSPPVGRRGGDPVAELGLLICAVILHSSGAGPQRIPFEASERGTVLRMTRDGTLALVQSSRAVGHRVNLAARPTRAGDVNFHVVSGGETGTGSAFPGTAGGVETLAPP